MLYTALAGFPGVGLGKLPPRHTYPSVHSLQQAHQSKLDWEIGGKSLCVTWNSFSTWKQA